MPKLKDYIPETTKLSNYAELNSLWNKVYKHRRTKSGKKRAIYAANARIYAECLKQFSQPTLSEQWKKKRKKAGRMIVEENTNKEQWNSYEVDDNTVYLSTEKRMLDDFPNAERKGTIKNMDDPFEQELISKIMERYEIRIHPQMYYVINGE